MPNIATNHAITYTNNNNNSYNDNNFNENKITLKNNNK